MIPSTYVFLSLYSLINLNVINWGTREAVAKATGQASYRENIAERVLRRVANLNDENSFLTRLLIRCRGNAESSEKLRTLERKIERTERLLLSLQVGGFFWIFFNFKFIFLFHFSNFLDFIFAY